MWPLGPLCNLRAHNLFQIDVEGDNGGLRLDFVYFNSGVPPLSDNFKQNDAGNDEMAKHLFLQQLQDLNGGAMVDNFRPVQPLNDRNLVVTSEELAENGMVFFNSASTAVAAKSYDVYDKEWVLKLNYWKSVLELIQSILVMGFIIFGHPGLINMYKDQKIRDQKIKDQKTKERSRKAQFRQKSNLNFNLMTDPLNVVFSPKCPKESPWNEGEGVKWL